MKFGDSVIVTGRLKRVQEYQERNRHIKKRVKAHFQTAQEGIFLGYRTLSNGRRDYYSEEGYSFTPTEHFRAALVCCNGRENPFYVDLEDVRLSDVFPLLEKVEVFMDTLACLGIGSLLAPQYKKDWAELHMEIQEKIKGGR